MSLVTENLKTYRIFVAMHYRCGNPKCKAYPNYGGRGITVCETWASFSRFLEDMGPQPPGMILDRIDNERGYSAANCRWVTAKQSARNTRRTRLVTAFGHTACISEWAEKTGLNKTTIQLRLNRGWSAEAAVSMSTEPKNQALDDLERFIEKSGDLTPIYYLVDKFLKDKTQQQSAALAQAAPLLAQLAPLLKQAGL